MTINAERIAVIKKKKKKKIVGEKAEIMQTSFKLKRQVANIVGVEKETGDSFSHCCRIMCMCEGG